MLTTVNDERRASNLVPFLLVYWFAVQNGGEDLIYQRAIRRLELGRGDPFVDNTLRGGVIAKIYPV